MEAYDHYATVRSAHSLLGTPRPNRKSSAAKQDMDSSGHVELPDLPVAVGVPVGPGTKTTAQTGMCTAVPRGSVYILSMDV